MISTIVKTTFISALLLVSTSAFSANSYTSQDKLVKQFNKAGKNVAEAQQMFAEALGLKKDAAKMGAEVEAFDSGAVEKKDALKRFAKKSKKTNKKILARMETTDSLSADAKEKFAKGLEPYFAGLVETSKISGAAAKFMKDAKKTISSASLIDKLGITKKLGPGMYVAEAAPGFVENLYDSSKTIIAFAKAQGIDVPDDALSEVSFN
jgi:hypothetical protein